MSRTQIQQLVVVILLIAFGIIWNISRTSTLTPPGIPAAASRATPAEIPPAFPGGSETSQPPPEIARDLFLPPSLLQEKVRKRELEAQEQLKKQTEVLKVKPVKAPPVPVDLSRFELQGIFWGTAPPQAIINRQILSVGDEIDGAKITSISKDRVFLSVGGTEAELKPPGAPASRPAENPEGKSWTSPH